MKGNVSRQDVQNGKTFIFEIIRYTEEIFIRNLKYVTPIIKSLHVGDVDAAPRRSRHDRRVHLLLVLEVLYDVLLDARIQIRDCRLGNRREHRSHSPPISGRPRGRHQAPPEVEIRENRKRSSYDVSALRARIRTTGARSQTLNGERSVVDPAARRRGRGCRRRRFFRLLRGR